MKSKTKETSLRLNLIRILTSNPDGLTLEELSQASGIRSEKELKSTLGKLFMIGTYPYTPLDYLELDHDGNRIKLLIPQNPNQTIALRSIEWLILRDSLIREWEESEDKLQKQTIQGILDKIKKIVPFNTLIDFQDLKKSLQSKIKNRERISFQYQSRGLKDSPSEKRIMDPWYLWEDGSILSNSYLMGMDITRNAPRIFRIDSIIALEPTGEKFPTPDHQLTQDILDKFREFLNQSRESGDTAVIWHTRKSHYYLNQIFQLDTEDNSKTIHGKEYIRSTCKIREKNWFLEQLIGFFPDAFLESPSDLVEEIKLQISSAKDNLSNLSDINTVSMDSAINPG